MVRREGWPEGELGEQLAALYSIKENGQEGLLRPLVRRDGRFGPPILPT